MGKVLDTSMREDVGSNLQHPPKKTTGRKAETDGSWGLADK